MQRDKKRKHPGDDRPNNRISNPQSTDIDTSKPTALFNPDGPRKSTLSVALPGSIIANAKSHDQKTYLAGTIARAFAVFCVDKVIVFDDTAPTTTSSSNGANKSHSRPRGTDEEGYTALSDPSHFLIHLLSFLETPPHLRKSLFPMHPNLRTAGTLPSLDMPHHLRANEWCEYREGVTTGSTKQGTGVDVGLGDDYILPDVQIPAKTRVTVKLPEDSEAVEAQAVAPDTPRTTTGYYWGYTVRRAGSLSAVFTESAFEGGYDISFGTSERGKPIVELVPDDVPRYQHLLLLFGGVAGLETAARNDPELSEKGITPANVSDLFDYWVNLVPGQGSRTIRTEEAVWTGLMGLKRIVDERRS